MKTLNWEQYLNLFEDILSGKFTNEIYEKPAYLDYVKMNFSRVNRWLKHAEIDDVLVANIKNIEAPQTWYLITEPWCGDAAHSTPFISKLAALNPAIELKIVLRDENLEFMDQYLTNGGRSIPKLVVRDINDSDLFDWGPRPAELKQIHAELKADNQPFEVINSTLQNWYNKNKGAAILNELGELFSIQRVG